MQRGRSCFPLNIRARPGAGGHAGPETDRRFAFARRHIAWRLEVASTKQKDPQVNGDTESHHPGKRCLSKYAEQDYFHPIREFTRSPRPVSSHNYTDDLTSVRL